MIRMNITLIYENIEHQNLTGMLLDEVRYTVNQTFALNSSWFSSIKQEEPDLLVFSVDEPDSDLFKQLCLLKESPICPIIVLTQSKDDLVIEKTILSGADSCIVGELTAERINSIIKLAIARHHVYFKLQQEMSDLKQEVESLESKLSDRKDIERAKGVLMKSYKMNEEDAYNAMRNMAMDTGNKLGEIARNLISMTKILN